MLYKEIPFLRICLPLSAGVISGLLLKPESRFFLVSAALISFVFILSLFFNRRESNVLFGLFTTSSFFFTGLLLYSTEKKRLSELGPEDSIYSVTLSDYPSEKLNTWLMTVRLNARMTNNGPEPVKGSVLLYCRKDHFIEGLLPGDLLMVRFAPSAIIPKGNPCEFDYRFYMENRGIKYFSIISSKDILEHTTPVHVKARYRALMVRESIIRMYRDCGVTENNLGVISAITLGRKDMLDPERKESFKRSGVMHLMAVSGLHTGIISLFVFNALFFLKKRCNSIRVVVTVLILWIFAFVTGLAPSVLRAALMFSFLHAGSLLKRPVNGINSVLASAFVLIIIRPSVIFDAGFLLSFSAVIYIIAFYRQLYLKLVFKNYIAGKIWQSVSVTLTAQTGTLPLTITLFNQFPVYFVIANLVVIPLASLLVITGCLVPLFYHLHFLSHILATVLNKVADLTEFITRTVSSLPLATPGHPGMTISECILLTITLFLLTSFLLGRRSMSVLYPLFFMFLYLLAGTFREISVRSSSQLIVYNTPGRAAVGVRTGKTLCLYSDTAGTSAEVMRHCSVLGLNIEHYGLNENGNCILAGNLRILIAATPDKEIIEIFHPDYLIITGKMSGTYRTGDIYHCPGARIIATKGPFRLQLNRDGKQNPVYIVSRAGAYVARI